MSHEQQASVGAETGQRLERLGRIEAARQRRVRRQAGALLLGPSLGGKLGCLSGANLGTEQGRLEARLQAGERHSRDPRLCLSPRRQPARRVLTGAVRLGIRMTK